MGYWYLPARVWAPEKAAPGTGIPVRIEWLNRGVAPAYRHYPLSLGMETPDGEVVLEQVVASDNRSWMPDEPVIETYAIELPEDVPVGTYHLFVRMAFESARPPRPIELGLAEERRRDGRYRLTTLTLD